MSNHLIGEILSEYLPEGDKRVLDAGSGSRVWKHPQYQIVRCDINPTDSKVLKVDLNKDLPFEDKEFDGVVCIEVIEHLENPWHLLREFKRVAKEFVFVSSPNNESALNRELFFKTGKFEWFRDEHVLPDYHINPIFSWEMCCICKGLGLELANIFYAVNDSITVYDIKVRR